MKQVKKLFGALLAVLLMTTIAACSDDKKNDEPAAPAAKSIEGSYTGPMSCTVMGNESVFDDLTFEVEATDDATVSVTIPSFGEPPMKMPSMTVSGVAVSGTDGSYTLSSTEFKGTTANGKSYSGTLTGNSENGTLTLRFNLNYGAMPMPLICTFTADKK